MHNAGEQWCSRLPQRRSAPAVQAPFVILGSGRRFARVRRPDGQRRRACRMRYGARLARKPCAGARDGRQTGRRQHQRGELMADALDRDFRRQRPAGARPSRSTPSRTPASRQEYWETPASSASSWSPMRPHATLDGALSARAGNRGPWRRPRISQPLGFQPDRFPAFGGRPVHFQQGACTNGIGMVVTWRAAPRSAIIRAFSGLPAR